MNLALSTLTFLALLLPGFIFRRFYYTQEFSKEYFKQTFTDLLLPSLILSVIIHILCYKPAQWMGIGVDIKTIGPLISGYSNSKDVIFALDAVYSNRIRTIQYFIFIGLLSFLLGLLSKLIVRNFKLDRKYKLFRFQNEWHYLFTGEILDFPKVPGNADDIDLVFVDALVETHEGTVIYGGILADYVLSSANGIDRIYLRNVRRRYLKDDDENLPKRYYAMPGEFFVIPFERILNLHITYYGIQIEETGIQSEIEQIRIDDV